jgi:CheY-like chemotaxis protein
MTAQNMAKKILSEAGYEVTTVSNGAAALKKIAEKTPDLVILDIYMPGYTGLEVCERVKRAAATSGLPVLLSVGKLEPYREQDATAVHADGVIVKPFEATELVTIVTNVILRASGAGIDFAPRISTPPVATTPLVPETAPPVVAQPLVPETAPPVVVPVDYAAELAMLESYAPGASREVSYSPTTTASAEYVGTSLPPVEKPLAMAVSAAAPATEVSNFAASAPPAVEAPSSMPFMIEAMLKADDKVPVDESEGHFSGPVLDVSPVEQASELDVSAVEHVPGLEVSPAEPVAEPHISAVAEQLPELRVSPDENVDGEDIEIIEIPAPEPSAATQVSEAAQPIEGGADIPPEELTAIDVEAFLREHAAAAESELPSPTEATPDRAAPDESEGAIAEWLSGHDIESTAVVPDASGPPAPSLEDRPAVLIARDDKSVFEIDDEPLFASAANGVVETAPVITAYMIEESIAQPAVEKAFVAAVATEAFTEPVLEAAATEPLAAPAPEQAAPANETAAPANEPAAQAPEPAAQVSEVLAKPEPVAPVPVEQVSVEPKFVAQAPAPEHATTATSAATESEVNPANTMATESEVNPANTMATESEVNPANTMATESEVKPTIAAAAEDFMFSVPMMLEGTAAMSLPEMSNPGTQPGLQPAGRFAADVPAYPAESARPAAIDEAAVAGAVQRVLDRFKPQIVAEIVREMAKHKH